MISAAGDLVLATSITLPVVRHPVVVAKTLSTLATLAGGRCWKRCRALVPS